MFMKSKGMLITTLGCLGAMAILGQAPSPAPQTPAAPRQGPGVQAPQDARYAEFIATKCKTPPAGRGGRGGGGGGAAGGGGQGAAAGAAGGAGRGDGRGGGRGNAAAGPPMPREYMVKEIPGVIAAGQ